MQTQPPAVNPDVIRSMFSKVAARYDRANSILSVGIHHLWRSKLVKLSEAQAGNDILDCATGTGDLAIAFKKLVGPEGKVIGSDFCAEMLETAPVKAAQNGISVRFEQADVTQLPYQENQFDICSISFGIRNVSNPQAALNEMARVTKPNGRVMILEFGKMDHFLLGPIYNFYSETVLPFLGGIVTGQPDAYDYLQKSSASFPCRNNFIKLMEETGKFSKMEYFPLSFGIAYIYRGTVKK